VVVRAGEDSVHFYFIDQGTVHIILSESKSDGPKVLVLGSGECFGETALMRPAQKRGATVIAASRVTLLSLPSHRYYLLFIFLCVYFFIYFIYLSLFIFTAFGMLWTTKEWHFDRCHRCKSIWQRCNYIDLSCGIPCPVLRFSRDFKQIKSSPLLPPSKRYPFP